MSITLPFNLIAVFIRRLNSFKLLEIFASLGSLRVF